jgi:hypothetical protein
MESNAGNTGSDAAEEAAAVDATIAAVLGQAGAAAEEGGEDQAKGLCQVAVAVVERDTDRAAAGVGATITNSLRLSVSLSPTPVCSLTHRTSGLARTEERRTRVYTTNFYMERRD